MTSVLLCVDHMDWPIVEEVTASERDMETVVYVYCTLTEIAGGREGGREGRREGGREDGGKEGREGGREEGKREGGREEGGREEKSGDIEMKTESWEERAIVSLPIYLQ